MWHLCTEMSKEDHLIITEKNRIHALRTFCYHEQKKRLHVEEFPQCAVSFLAFRHCLF